MYIVHWAACMLASSELDSMVYFFLFVFPHFCIHLSVHINYFFPSLSFVVVFFFRYVIQSLPAKSKTICFFFPNRRTRSLTKKEKNKCRNFEISGSISIAKSLFSTLLSFSWFSTFRSLELFRSKKAIGFWDFDVIVWKKKQGQLWNPLCKLWPSPCTWFIYFWFFCLIAAVVPTPFQLKFFLLPPSSSEREKKKTKKQGRGLERNKRGMARKRRSLTVESLLSGGDLKRDGAHLPLFYLAPPQISFFFLPFIISATLLNS